MHSVSIEEKEELIDSTEQKSRDNSVSTVTELWDGLPWQGIFLFIITSPSPLGSPILLYNG
jgi:hypothetical protein